MARVAQHGEQALQEAEGAEVVELAPDACRPPDRGRDVRLTAEPGHQPFGGARRRRRDRGAVARSAAANAGVVPRHRESPARAVSTQRQSASTTPSADARSNETTRRAPAGGRTAGTRQSAGTRTIRRYTVSSRCSGVSVSEICTSAVAMPSRLARSASQRAKNVLPDAVLAPHRLEHGPAAGDGRLARRRRAASNRSRPTASTSSPFCGTVPRRSASMISRRRAGTHGRRHRASPNCSRSRDSSSTSRRPSASRVSTGYCSTLSSRWTCRTAPVSWSSDSPRAAAADAGSNRPPGAASRARSRPLPGRP